MGIDVMINSTLVRVRSAHKVAFCFATLVMANSHAGNFNVRAASNIDRTVNSEYKVSYAVEQIKSGMVSVPDGYFTMGNSKKRGPSSESPAHRVHIKAFRISKYEVTFEQYEAYAEATQNKVPNDEGWGRGNRPVVNISWHDAQQFIEWLNRETGLEYRLPSEAEWEYAARSGTSTDYPWGDKFDSNLANGRAASGAVTSLHTAPVGSYPPNNWKLYDMIGNVMEWTADCWNANYIAAPTDGSAWSNGDCAMRVFRGGAWAVTPSYLTVSFRMFVDTSFRNSALGFRLAADP